MRLPSSSATELNKPNLRHFLKTQDFTKQELEEILELMAMLKQARRDNAVPQLFKGKSVAMIFEQPSTVPECLSKLPQLFLGAMHCSCHRRISTLVPKSRLKIPAASCHAWLM